MPKGSLGYGFVMNEGVYVNLELVRVCGCVFS